ncbi:hypothetical protein BJV78DRAFT_1189651 [Lactifluus subvellereus]|nr:hypothetical protein BJV78DRAFT_1189651 [Lactifluus subvellereus]
MPHKRAKRSVREQQRKERGTDLAPPSDPGSSGGASIGTEGIPKSVARVLDAAKIRAEYRKKRARLEADANDDGDGSAPISKKRRTGPPLAGGDTSANGKGAKEKLKGRGGETTMIEIQPGESLKAFNRRVEDHMRPLVRSAVRASAATERKERKVIAAAAPGAKTQQLSPTTKTKGRNVGSKHDDAEEGVPIQTADKHRDRPKEFATTSSAAPRRLNDAQAPRPRAVASSGGRQQHAAQTKAAVLSMAQRAVMVVERENAIRRYREMKERKSQGN